MNDWWKWIVFFVILIVGLILVNVKSGSTAKNTGTNPHSPASKKGRTIWMVIKAILMMLLILLLVALIGVYFFVELKTNDEPKPKAKTQTNQMHNQKFTKTIIVNIFTDHWESYSLESIYADAQRLGFSEKDLYISFSDATTSYCVKNKSGKKVCADAGEDATNSFPSSENNRHWRFISQKESGSIKIHVYKK